jgi:hypothetical protein
VDIKPNIDPFLTWWLTAIPICLLHYHLYLLILILPHEEITLSLFLNIIEI